MLTSSARRVPARAARKRFHAWLLALLLGLSTLLLYWPTLRNDYVNYDDNDYVTANPHVAAGLKPASIAWAFTHSRSANWHPMTWLSLMLDIDLFGNHAAGMHFTNTVLHAASVMLLFWLLRTLTGADGRSAVVAAIFGWHPLHVESVAWVSERKDVLSAFFGFLSLWLYVCYAQAKMARADTPQEGRRPPASVFLRRATLFYWLAGLFLALGLMSKSMLVTWPFLMLLLDYWPLKRWAPGGLRALAWEKAPFFALAVAVSVITYLAQKGGGAVAATEQLPLTNRCANALIVYCAYLGKLFWPAQLAVFYPHPVNWPAGRVLAAALLLVCISAVVLVRARRQPFLLMGWLWYLGTLVPVIGLVQVGRQSMADRYMYIPSVGITIMLVWGGFALIHRWRPALGAGSLVMAVALILCAGLTRVQIGHWRDSESLFRHALAVTQDNFVAHNALAGALEEEGNLDAAIKEYYETLRLQPEAAPAHNNLGTAFARKNRLDDAIVQFREAIRLSPSYGPAHENLGRVLLQKNEFTGAIAEFRTNIFLTTPDNVFLAHYYLGLAFNATGQTNAAILEFNTAVHLQPDYAPARASLALLYRLTCQRDAEISQLQALLKLTPDDADAHYNLGNALLARGETDAAVSQFQDAIRLRPDDADAHNNLGNLLAREGHMDEAIDELAETLRLTPENADARYNLANIYLQTGQITNAISQFQEALRRKPNFAPAHYNLGVAYNKSGQPRSAIHEFQTAIHLKPDYAIAHNSLGITLAGQGQIDEAITEFQAAIRINPNYTTAKTNLERAQALKNNSNPPAKP